MATADARPAALAPIAYIFQTNDGLIRQTLSDLPADALWKQPAGGGNSIMWIVGHITQAYMKTVGPYLLRRMGG